MRWGRVQGTGQLHVTESMAQCGAEDELAHSSSRQGRMGSCHSSAYTISVFYHFFSRTTLRRMDTDKLCGPEFWVLKLQGQGLKLQSEVGCGVR